MADVFRAALFVNPKREEDAAKLPVPSPLVPIRIGVFVPEDEAWWCEELPDEIRVVNEVVSLVRTFKIIHKLTLSR